MKSLIYTFLFLIPFAFAFVACEGPAGPQGEQGPAGPTGAAGTDGADGSANVTTVELIWTSNDVQTSSDGTYGFVSFQVAEITQTVADAGAVLAHYNQSLGGSGWIALPITNSYDNDGDGEIDRSIEFTYAYDTGIAELYFINTNGDPILESDFREGKVKLTLIPPSSASKMKGSEFDNRVKTKGLRNH